MDKLRILTGSLQGAVIELLGEEITVGRAPDNAVCLDDESVSEHHATLAYRGQDWMVQDAGSAHGTFVRGKKVRTAKLQNGDVLAFGSVELLLEATEKKPSLQAGQVFAPAASVDTTWLRRRGAIKRLLISTVRNLLQLIVFAAVAYGGYWMYQKLRRMGPDTETTSPSAAHAVSWASPPAAPALSVPTGTPVPAASQPVQPGPAQPVTSASPPAPVQPVAPAVPATRPCVVCGGTGELKCRWCRDGRVDCPGPCLKLSRGVWERLNVAGHDPNELWQKFYNKHGGYRAWSQGHVGQVIEMQDGEPVNIGPCKICGGAGCVPCAHCQGAGKVGCPTCRGTGSVPQPYGVPGQR